VNGRSLMAAMLVFAAYYTEVDGLRSLGVQGVDVAVDDYTGIDSETSGLKRRGCFAADPDDFAALVPMEKPTPLKAPGWFECFDYASLTQDLEAGRAVAFLAAENEKDGIDRVVAIYPDGRGFEWRQLNARYADQ
jgi:hypothetical protein